MELAKHKEDRISIRLNADQKSVIDEAAQVLGISLSSFVLSNALEAANRIAGRQHHIELSERDWNRFVEILSTDIEPTPAALKAANRYTKGHRLEQSRG